MPLHTYHNTEYTRTITTNQMLASTMHISKNNHTPPTHPPTPTKTPGTQYGHADSSGTKKTHHTQPPRNPRRNPMQPVPSGPNSAPPHPTPHHHKKQQQEKAECQVARPTPKGSTRPQQHTRKRNRHNNPNPPPPPQKQQQREADTP